MFVETMHWIIQLIFPRGTRRNFFAFIVAECFRFPNKISCIATGLARRKRLYVKLPLSTFGNGVPLLFVDDYVPDPRIGAGAPRTWQILKVLVEKGFRVTFFPLVRKTGFATSLGYFADMGVEILYGETSENCPILTSLLHYRKDHYQVIVISRPTNMKVFHNVIRRYQRNAKLVYD